MNELSKQELECEAQIIALGWGPFRTSIDVPGIGILQAWRGYRKTFAPEGIEQTLSVLIYREKYIVALTSFHRMFEGPETTVLKKLPAGHSALRYLCAKCGEMNESHFPLMRLTNKVKIGFVDTVRGGYQVSLLGRTYDCARQVHIVEGGYDAEFVVTEAESRLSARGICKPGDRWWIEGSNGIVEIRVANATPIGGYSLVISEPPVEISRSIVGDTCLDVPENLNAADGCIVTAALMLKIEHLASPA